MLTFGFLTGVRAAGTLGRARVGSDEASPPLIYVDEMVTPGRLSFPISPERNLRMLTRWHVLSQSISTAIATSCARRSGNQKPLSRPGATAVFYAAASDPQVVFLFR
jgi:hypothetical protein